MAFGKAYGTDSMGERLPEEPACLLLFSAAVT